MPRGYYNKTGLPLGVYKRTKHWKLSDKNKRNIIEGLRKAHQEKQFGFQGKNIWSFKEGNKIRVGLKHTEKTKIKMRLSHLGKKPNWKGGITPYRIAIWRSKEYQKWRNNIFRRDNFICQKCKIKGGKLEAHHLLSFTDYPKLRLEIKNGITLCKKCHEKTENYGGKSNKRKIP